MKSIILIFSLIFLFNCVLSVDVLVTEIYQGTSCDPLKLIKTQLNSPCTAYGKLSFNTTHYFLLTTDPDKLNPKCDGYNQTSGVPEPLNKCQSDRLDSRVSYIIRRKSAQAESDILQMVNPNTCSQIITYGSSNCTSNMVMFNFPQHICFPGGLSDGKLGYLRTNCTSNNTFVYECGQDASCSNCTLLSSPANNQCVQSPNPFLNPMYSSFQYNKESIVTPTPTPTPMTNNTTPKPSKPVVVDSTNTSSNLFVSFLQLSISLLITLLFLSIQMYMKKTKYAPSLKPSSVGSSSSSGAGSSHIANDIDSSPIDKNGNVLYNPDYTHYVVHCQKTEYDVYIGRKNPKIDQSGNFKWGNPFKVGTHGDRNECVLKYRDWIFHKDQSELFQQAKKELHGKIIACWCSPLNCHGYVLAEIANSSVTNIDYKSVSKPSVRTTYADPNQSKITSFFVKKEVNDTAPSYKPDPNSWASLIQKEQNTTKQQTTSNSSTTSTVTSSVVATKPVVDSEKDFPTLGLKKK
ncbi:hypothetical protein PPL_02282 [Heterostelium album PN500]|uniref:DUF4326 domain-containing protein n=1 Tax=Heterostelium pallidum (strain ATCC 26659 / Pp 5 / PN500) TaxID=670386 RepID=D3B1V7_HETP5|nr:hypothetical protein PPL_02282 [Heterostelium album PN500]EFA85281.1 hypothetical protein PPL_02282 [Heterostelium album PN500]|eukprot:XP_020437390.1 hypothetical protein PPL_02282 [Heterostelium album PN500]